MKLYTTICAVCLAATTLYAVPNPTGAVEQIDQLAEDIHPTDGVIVLKGTHRISTKASFKPPVEITIVAKTDSTNLRIAYAADQVIFNWELDPAQLRVDGGPAHRQYIHGAGEIPKNKFVTIKWIVLSDEQKIFVDGDLRLQHRGDYSAIDRPVAVFPRERSKVTVASIKVRDLSDQPEPATGNAATPSAVPLTAQQTTNRAVAIVHQRQAAFTCPRCGYEQIEGATKCTHCGAGLPKSPATLKPVAAFVRTPHSGKNETESPANTIMPAVAIIKTPRGTGQPATEADASIKPIALAIRSAQAGNNSDAPDTNVLAPETVVQCFTNYQNKSVIVAGVVDHLERDGTAPKKYYLILKGSLRCHMSEESIHDRLGLPHRLHVETHMGQKTGLYLDGGSGSIEINGSMVVVSGIVSKDIWKHVTLERVELKDTNCDFLRQTMGSSVETKFDKFIK